MIFKATEQQAKQIAANACAASKPMGMGFLHWKADQEFTADMFEISERGTHREGIFCDYVGGRMVKLSMFKEKGNDNLWQFMAGEPKHDYQSWVHKYPTYKDLALSVDGVEVME